MGSWKLVSFFKGRKRERKKNSTAILEDSKCVAEERIERRPLALCKEGVHLLLRLVLIILQSKEGPWCCSNEKRHRASNTWRTHQMFFSSFHFFLGEIIRRRSSLARERYGQAARFERENSPTAKGKIINEHLEGAWRHLVVVDHRVDDCWPKR